jgi:hypothetical protein
VETSGLQLAGAANVVLPKGVAAIDQRIPGFEQPRKLGDRGFGCSARGQHEPHDARLLQRLDQLGAARRRDGPFGGKQAPRRGVAVVDYAGVAVAHEATSDIGAHAPQAHDTDLHDISPAIV